MAKIFPEIYFKYTTIDAKGSTVLYISTINAVYGIVKYALLSYLEIVKGIKSKIFQLNTYDPCIMRKIIKGYQITLVWNVYYINITHMYS